MIKSWRKIGRTEQEILNWEKEKFNKFDKAFNDRDYSQELKDMGLSDEQCTDVLEWVNKLSIHITGNNHTVNIIDGIIKVSNTKG